MSSPTFECEFVNIDLLGIMPMEAGTLYRKRVANCINNCTWQWPDEAVVHPATEAVGASAGLAWKVSSREGSGTRRCAGACVTPVHQYLSLTPLSHMIVPGPFPQYVPKRDHSHPFLFKVPSMFLYSKRAEEACCAAAVVRCQPRDCLLPSTPCLTLSRYRGCFHRCCHKPRPSTWTE